MREVRHIDDIEVGQQIAWTYDTGDGTPGPLAGRVTAKGLNGFVVKRERGNSNFTKELPCDHLTVWILKEKPEMVEIPRNLIDELIRARGNLDIEEALDNLEEYVGGCHE